MQYLRHRSVKTRWVSLLSLILLFQACFPLQAHTRLAIDGHGQVVELCTLQGLRRVPADGDPADQPGDQHGSTRSAAVAFSSIMFAAAPHAGLPLLVATNPSYDIPFEYRAPALISPRALSSPIRAPPTL